MAAAPFWEMFKNNWIKGATALEVGPTIDDGYGVDDSDIVADWQTWHYEAPVSVGDAILKCHSSGTILSSALRAILDDH